MPRDLKFPSRAAPALLLGVLAAAGARAGPPYQTDDPEPTDTGHWEIYAFASGTRDRGAVEGSTGLDLNYGPVEGVQLTATLPLDVAHDRRTRLGTGDVEVGVKYRFLHREAAGVSAAIFPRVILPAAGRGFGTGRVRLLLPVWAEQDIGRWSLFGGGGYTINPGAGRRDYWQAGLALTRRLSGRLSLGGEVAHRGPDAVGGHAMTSFGLGGIYRLGGPFSLLVSGGPAVIHRGGGVAANVYTALGIAF